MDVESQEEKKPRTQRRIWLRLTVWLFLAILLPIPANLADCWSLAADLERSLWEEAVSIYGTPFNIWIVVVLQLDLLLFSELALAFAYFRFVGFRRWKNVACLFLFYFVFGYYLIDARAGNDIENVFFFIPQAWLRG